MRLPRAGMSATPFGNDVAGGGSSALSGDDATSAAGCGADVCGRSAFTRVATPVRALEGSPAGRLGGAYSRQGREMHEGPVRFRALG